MIIHITQDLTCAYCAWCVDCPATMAERLAVIRAHVLACPEHPMRAVEKQRDELLARGDYVRLADAPWCRHNGCQNAARHAPPNSKDPVACWQHAGDWPEVAP